MNKKISFKFKLIFDFVVDMGISNSFANVMEEVFSEKFDSPFIKILLVAMEDFGCPVTPQHFYITKCNFGPDVRGAFDSTHNQIIICSDAFEHNFETTKKYKLENVIAHELIHALDHCRAESNFHHNPDHLMCTEIRAATLSGECMLANNKIDVLFDKFFGFHKTCVKRKALSSFMTLFKDYSKADSLMLFDKVFSSCYFDTTPFDKAPMSRKQAELSYKAYMQRNKYKI